MPEKKEIIIEDFVGREHNVEPLEAIEEFTEEESCGVEEEA